MNGRHFLDIAPISKTDLRAMLDGLEKTAGQAATAFNTPPLDIAGLRKDWAAMRAHVKTIPALELPSADAVWNSWKALRREADAQKRSVFEMSSVMALSADRGTMIPILTNVGYQPMVYKSARADRPENENRDRASGRASRPG